MSYVEQRAQRLFLPCVFLRAATAQCGNRTANHRRRLNLANLVLDQQKRRLVIFYFARSSLRWSVSFLSFCPTACVILSSTVVLNRGSPPRGVAVTPPLKSAVLISTPLYLTWFSLSFIKFCGPNSGLHANVTGGRGLLKQRTITGGVVKKGFKTADLVWLGIVRVIPRYIAFDWVTESSSPRRSILEQAKWYRYLSLFLIVFVFFFEENSHGKLLVCISDSITRKFCLLEKITVLPSSSRNYRLPYFINCFKNPTSTPKPHLDTHQTSNAQNLL